MLSGLIEPWIFFSLARFILFLFTHFLMRKWFIPRIAGYENDCIVLWKRECWFSKGFFFSSCESVLLIYIKAAAIHSFYLIFFFPLSFSSAKSFGSNWPYSFIPVPPDLVLLFLSVVLLCMLTWLIFDILNKSTSSWMKNISI